MVNAFLLKKTFIIIMQLLMNFPRYAFGLFAVLRQKLWDAGK